MGHGPESTLQCINLEKLNSYFEYADTPKALASGVHEEDIDAAAVVAPEDSGLVLVHFVRAARI